MLDGAVVINQFRDGYRVTSDSVLLAAAVPARPLETVIDIGAGTGAISLCLAHRVSDLKVTALERYLPHLSLLRKNISRNRMDHRVEAVEGDLAAPPLCLNRRLFDHVVTNPPFGERGCTRLAMDPGRRIARHESDLGLEDWISACISFLAPGGSLTLVVQETRRSKAADILNINLPTLRILPLVSRSGLPPKRVILQGWAVQAHQKVVYPPLLLHPDRGKGYTHTVESVLRRGRNLLDMSAPLVVRPSRV